MTQRTMSLREVALLAQVDRSVVTHWRTRYAARHPFPSAHETREGQELFACAEVVAWLAATGLGNNPDAADHVIAFEATDGRVLLDDRLFEGITALLCLHARHGALPDDADRLCDLADAFDPNNEFVYREVEALGPEAGPLAVYVNLLVGASLDPTDPFDDLMAGRRTPGRPAGGRLAPDAAGLALDLAVGLADQAGFDEPTLCLLRPEDVELLAALQGWLDERGPTSVALADGPEAATRLARRWLFAHDLSATRLARGDGAGLPEQAVVLLRLRDADRLADLEALDELALNMSGGLRAVVVGTAAALTGPLRRPVRGRPPASGVPLSEAGETRRSVLRTGFVRAIVRLPGGVFAENPAAHGALWCLAPAAGAAETYCLDARGDRGLVDAPHLLGDLLTAVSGQGGRTHLFPRGRFVRQAELELADGELVGRAARASFVGPAGVLADLHALAEAVGRDVAADWTLTVLDGSRLDGAGQVRRLTVQQAIAGGDLHELSGLRVLAEHLDAQPDVAVVHAPDELRRADRLPGLSHVVINAHYGHAQLTEPGDVVFDPKQRVAARVDDRGGLLVASPARVLRCVAPEWTDEERDAAKASGRRLRERAFLPELVAAELNAQAAGSRDWRAWRITPLPPVELMPPPARRAAADAVRATAQRQRQLEDALDQLPELWSTLATALGAGLCSVSVTERKSA